MHVKRRTFILYIQCTYIYIYPPAALVDCVRYIQGRRFDGPRGSKRNLSSGLIRRGIYYKYIYYIIYIYRYLHI